MHKFSSAAPPPSSERSEEIIRRAASPDPQGGCPDPQAGAPGLVDVGIGKASHIPDVHYPLTSEASELAPTSLRDQNPKDSSG